MDTPKKFWLVLGGAVLAMVFIACSCPSVTPVVMPTSTLTVVPPPATLFVRPTPTMPVNPLPELVGYWQDGSKVFKIEWQGSQYVVTALTAAGTGTRTLAGQSWDGSSLTWTYDYSDENGNSSVTYKTVSVGGDILTADYSSSDGTVTVHLLMRVTSPTPSYYSLPYYDDFSSSTTGWDVFITNEDSAGYDSGYYAVISRTNQFTSYGAAGRFFGDTIIEVDANPVSGPANNNFSYDVGCRVQTNADGYIFEISGDGYFAVGYYSGGGNNYTSLLSGDEWQPSDAIQQGMTTNHIAVTCAGSQLRLEINGQTLYEGQDSTFTEGDISLGAGTYYDNNTPAEVHFDNLVVSAP